MSTTAWVKTLLLTGICYSASVSATTSVIQLDFTGIANLEEVGEFYNGGTDGAGNMGTNYGVSFKGALIGLDVNDPLAPFSGEPTTPGIFTLFSTSAYINVANGFGTGLAFYYSTADYDPIVNIYSGLDMQGSLLGTLTLDALGAGPDPQRPYSNWKMAVISFNGIAKSIGITAEEAEEVSFDNLTFGGLDANIPVVPEPSSVLQLLFGMGVIAVIRRRIAKH
jgi:hypothetical protein